MTVLLIVAAISFAGLMAIQFLPQPQTADKQLSHSDLVTKAVAKVMILSIVGIVCISIYEAGVTTDIVQAITDFSKDVG